MFLWLVLTFGAVFPSYGSTQSGSSTAAKNSATTKSILFLGDSLTEGYGVDKEKESYPALIARRLQGKPYEIINSGISGSTSASGPLRLKKHFQEHPRTAVVVLALGANDGLRGFDPAVTAAELLATIKVAQEKGAKVLLCGMQMPPNYGPQFTQKYRQMFVDVAKKTQVPLVPFLLEGVGGKPEFNIADRIHPNVKGHEIIAATVWRYLEPLL